MLLDQAALAVVQRVHAHPNLDVGKRVVALMKKHPEGRDACIIGEIAADSDGKVYVQTAIGGRRSVEMLSGEQLPRIC